jgi:hypothetical protein
VAALLRPRGRLTTASLLSPFAGGIARRRSRTPIRRSHGGRHSLLRIYNRLANITASADCYIDFTFQAPANTRLVLLGGQLQVDQNQILRNIMHIRWKFFSITDENSTIR